MHPVNEVLSYLGLDLNRAARIPFRFRREYWRRLRLCRKNAHGFRVFRDFWYDAGTVLHSWGHFECAFSAFHLGRIRPAALLDVGSNTYFVLGLLAHSKVTTVDVRHRPALTENETVVVCDAKKLDLPSDSFDCVTSMCSLEHMGLGRYGDEFDLDADKKGFQEMVRVLKPGGHLIFTTSVTRSAPSIAFNAHRIYDHGMIRSFCGGLRLVEERFYSHRVRNFCRFEEVTTRPRIWDVYCGCWAK